MHFSVEMWLIVSLAWIKEMTRNVLIDESFIPHNLLFYANNLMLAWFGLREC